MQLRILAALIFVVACNTDQIGPRPQAVRVPTAGALDEGPPSSYPFGDDTNRPGLFTGGGEQKLVCQSGTTGGTYDGYLVSDADQTSLDAQLQVPAGTGPFPLVALVHGYGGSKSSSGDIAARLLKDGYAVLRYSTRGFGKSWGQVNLADLDLEIADLRSMIAQVTDDQANCNLDASKVAVTGASYGGGHAWLALLTPTFPTQPSRNKTVQIVAVAPIAPWTDLFYSLVPNGRPNASIEGFGGLKLSFVNGLYASGIRDDAERPYPNYPDYFIAWHAWIDGTEPSSVDPVWLQVRDGIAGYRSIYWQRDFWERAVHNRIPIFQVQGFTDDLFPLTEAKRMLLAINSVEPGYPITSYFGDVGHPRASNKPPEVSYVLDLISPWLAAYLKGGAPPAPKIYAARTRPRSAGFSPSDVLTVDTWDQLSTYTVAKKWDEIPQTLVNPVTFAQSGITWDPFVMEGAEQLKPYLEIPPTPAIVPTSYASYRVPAKTLAHGGDLIILGQPTVALDAVVAGHRVQLNVRLIDEGPTDYLITRGTYTIDAGMAVIGQRTIVIPTYGNYWVVPRDHTLRLEISNVDSPYLTPSREPSTTVISSVKLELPVR